MNKDTRNMIVAVLLSAIVLIGWTFFTQKVFPVALPPQPAKVATAPQAPLAATESAAPAVPGAVVPGVAPTVVTADRAAVLAASPRVAIRTPRLQGSLNLKGARFDDLVLPTYRVTVDKTSPPIRLLSPSGTTDAYFGQFGWSGPETPPADALWTASAAVLMRSAAPRTASPSRRF